MNTQCGSSSELSSDPSPTRQDEDTLEPVELVSVKVEQYECGDDDSQENQEVKSELPSGNVNTIGNGFSNDSLDADNSIKTVNESKKCDEDTDDLNVAGGSTICCELCGITFTSELYLLDHRRLCRGNRTVVEVVEVNKLPPDIQWLAQIRDGQKIYCCHLCAYETHRGGHMTRHLLSHMGARPYRCEECNKSFTQAEGLASHKLIHLGVKPYSCSECSFKCKRPTALKRHMATHTGEVMFACPQCEYKSAQKYNLKMHQRIHSRDKPYKCRHCEYRAIWRASVDKHERRVH